MPDFWTDRYVKADGRVVALAGGHRKPRFVRLTVWPFEDTVIEVISFFEQGKLVGADATVFDDLEWADDDPVEAVEILTDLDPERVLNRGWEEVVDQHERSVKRTDYSFD